MVPPRMISIEQALALLGEHVTPVGIESVPLDEARGRVLAVDVAAPWDLPTRTHAAMDGFAVRAVDTADATEQQPVTLRYGGACHAGDKAPPELVPGHAVAITTGSAIPAGADAVVRVEDTSRPDDDHVTISAAVEAARNIRHRGEDTRAGEIVLRAGIRLDGIAVGVLAMFGRIHVDVYERPRVVVTACGDELVPIERATPDAVVDSNSPMLVAMARDAGAEASSLGIAPDEPVALARQLQRATAKADVVITSAGASVGDRDLTRVVLDDAGATFVFAKVAIKPGKPVAYARLGSTHVFCLPGNPGAAAMTFELLVRPALLRLGGEPSLELPTTHALLTAPIHKRPGLAHCLWTTTRETGGGLAAAPLRAQSSASLIAGLGANAVAILPRDASELAAGQAARLVQRRPALPRRMPPVLGIVGFSNTGKTTLTAGLIARLSTNLRVAAVKHGHRFDFDRKGKDTQRFAEAGAATIAFASPSQRGLHVRTDRAPELDEVLASIPDDSELVLVEGYKLASMPKLEMVGPDGRCLTRDGALDCVVGLVSRAGPIAGDVPCFDASDLDAIEAWIRDNIVTAAAR